MTAPNTRAFDAEGRITLERIGSHGEIEQWIELPSSLKQPLMVLVGEVAMGLLEISEFPIPGGDRLVVSRRDKVGKCYGLSLKREPEGFPCEGRTLAVDGIDVPLFRTQVLGM